MEPHPTGIPDYRNPKAPPVAAGLSPEQIIQIQQADRRAKSIKRAVKLAVSEGVFSVIIAACSLPCFMFGWINTALGILFAIYAWVALRGANQLKRYDRSALALLAWNEVFLIAFMTVYAAWSIYTGLSAFGQGGGGMASAIISPEDIKLLGIDPKIIRELTWGFYLALIAITALSQGLVALYYKSREKHLDAYLKETPQWIVDFQRAQQRA